jgi:K+-sensing histidine kinase KdpD
MSATDDAADGITHAPLDQLRHDLKTPLTTIHGRAQLLDRAIRRSPTLSEDERARMLAAVVAIEAAVRAMVPLIDRLGEAGNDSRSDTG